MSLAFSFSSVAPRSIRSRMARAGSLALAVVASITLLSAAPRPANAEVPAEPPARWEFLMSSGAIVPAGEQRGAISSGGLSTVQLSYVAHPAMAVTATMGWACSRDLAFAGDPKLDLFSYDLGAEARAGRWQAGKSITFRPFAGVGAGARSYNHRHLDIAATHGAAVYASVGGELGIGRRVRLKLEARNYVTRFRPLTGEGGSDTRSDVALMAGLRLVSR